MNVNSQKRITWMIFGFALNIPAVGVCWWLDVDYSFSVAPSLCGLALAIIHRSLKEPTE